MTVKRYAVTSQLCQVKIEEHPEGRFVDIQDWQSLVKHAHSLEDSVSGHGRRVERMQATEEELRKELIELKETPCRRDLVFIKDQKHIEEQAAAYTSMVSERNSLQDKVNELTEINVERRLELDRKDQVIDELKKELAIARGDALPFPGPRPLCDGLAVDDWHAQSMAKERDERVIKVIQQQLECCNTFYEFIAPSLAKAIALGIREASRG